MLDDAATLADRFLTAYMSERDFFAAPDELEAPLVIPFSAAADPAAHALVLTFGLRPGEDTDEPRAEIVAFVDGCIAALLTAHPELAGQRIVVQYAN